MEIHFLTPPAAKARGGIDSAVQGLARALRDTGRANVSIGEPGSPAGDSPSSNTPDITHFHGLWQPSHSRHSKALRQTSAPYVVSPHGMLEPWAWRHRNWKKRPYFYLREKRHLARADSIFVTSDLERDNLRKLVTHSCVAPLPLGCEDPHPPRHEAARAELHWPAREHVLLYLSRIDRKKGLDLLLQALSKNPASHRGWRLVVVGDGDLAFLAQLQEFASRQAANLPPIDWVGPVWGEDRWRYLQGADLFCLPTHSENFGIAVLEALYAGTPVLTTDQTPWRDLAARPGIFIASPTIESLTATLSNALTTTTAWSEPERQRLSAETTAQFAWNSLAERYLHAYQVAIDRHRSQR